MSGLRDQVVISRAPTRLEVALRADTYNNNLDDYLRVLGLAGTDELKGLVLDIGPGDAELFSREMANLGRTVVSMNPQLVRPRSADMAINGFTYVQRGPFMMPEETNLPWARRSVAGLVQELPFADNTFGSIVSLGAIPAYLLSEDYAVSIEEMVRVLEPGGQAHLSPIVDIEGLPPYVDAFTKVLEQTGVSFSLEDVDSTGMMYEFQRAVITK